MILALKQTRKNFLLCAINRRRANHCTWFWKETPFLPPLFSSTPPWHQLCLHLFFGSFRSEGNEDTRTETFTGKLKAVIKVKQGFGPELQVGLRHFFRCLILTLTHHTHSQNPAQLLLNLTEHTVSWHLTLC